MSNKIKIIAQSEDDRKRLDAFLAENLADYTRSKLKNMIIKGEILLNGKVVKPSKEISENDEVEVSVLDAVEADIIAEDIEFDIIYQDNDFAIINKPQGLIVHPTSSLRTGTLVNGLMNKLENLSGINGVLRPGIVHRIDKDTSGLLVVAKNDMAHNNLAKQIQEKTCKRSYLAVCEGEFDKPHGRIETNIGRNPKDRKSMAVVRVGKVAITDYTVEEKLDWANLVRFDLHTGRTHQIRVHAKYIKHPIVGDKTYGHLKQKFKLKGQLLHAEKLELTHPTTGELMEFHAPLPSYFVEVLETLRNSLYI